MIVDYPRVTLYWLLRLVYLPQLRTGFTRCCPTRIVSLHTLVTRYVTVVDCAFVCCWFCAFAVAFTFLAFTFALHGRCVVPVTPFYAVQLDLVDFTLVARGLRLFGYAIYVTFGLHTVVYTPRFTVTHVCRFWT